MPDSKENIQRDIFAFIDKNLPDLFTQDHGYLVVSKDGTNYNMEYIPGKILNIRD